VTHYAAGHSVTNRHLRLLTRNRVIAHTGRREFTNDERAPSTTSGCAGA